MFAGQVNDKVDIEETEGAKYKSDAGEGQGKAVTRIAFGMLAVNAFLTLKDLLYGKQAQAAGRQADDAEQIDESLDGVVKRGKTSTDDGMMPLGGEELTTKPDGSVEHTQTAQHGPITAFARDDSFVVFNTQATAASMPIMAPHLVINQ